MNIDTTSGEFDFTYLSLGAGVQSSALLVLALTTDKIPTPDAVIFADTGDEPPWVYEYVLILSEWAAQFGIEIITASAGVLSESVINKQKSGERFVSVPIFTASVDGKKEGMLRRQCTREYKINPIMMSVKTLLGYTKGQWVRKKVRAMIGITLEESQRMKPAWKKWITNTYPLVDLGLTREDCKKIVTDAGLPEPKKSACLYCPYHSDDYWQWMKTTHPEVFQEAVEFDEAIRDMTMRGREQPGYIHRSCVPLKDAVFNSFDPFQTDMWAECEGICGV